jgi:hypothetical protein
MKEPAVPAPLCVARFLCALCAIFNDTPRRMQRIIPSTGRSIAKGGIAGGMVNALLITLAAATIVVAVRITVRIYLAHRITRHGPLKAAPTDALPPPGLPTMFPEALTAYM